MARQAFPLVVGTRTIWARRADPCRSPQCCQDGPPHPCSSASHQFAATFLHQPRSPLGLFIGNNDTYCKVITSVGLPFGVFCIVGKTNLPEFIFGPEQGSRLKLSYSRPRDLAQHHILIVYASVFQVTKHRVHRGTVAHTSEFQCMCTPHD
jgi:hypothetical protein